VTVYRVWAPHADRVELALGAAAAERRAMRREERGWWTADVAEAGPGTDYGFTLDGEGPFPDPRSAFQPLGVHGPSRVVDHDAFDWTDRAWSAPPLADAVLYELHVGTFADDGTFDGVIPHLDHLVELGVTHVELLPVAEFPGNRGWGYDGVDLFAPHHAYGGPDGLKRLVDACHARRLAVVLDVVYNHLGPDGNYLARFGPYFSHRYTTPWGDAINFDGPGSDEVRRFVIDNARTWLGDYHIDALRLDAVHEIFDQSAIHILEELATEVHALGAELGRRLDVIAESDLNNPRLVQPLDQGGYGLDAHWNDDFRHALHVTLTGERDRFHAQYFGIHDLAAALEEVYVFAGRYSPFRDRRHGRPADGIPATRFVGFLSNHDQVGNRAFGERLGHLVPPEAAMLGAAVVLLSPFVPLLFAGEEWAASTPFLYFTDHEDEELAEAVRRGRREEFAAFVPDSGEIPDPQDAGTLERSRLRWNEPDDDDHRRVLDWYRRLIAYRRDHPELRDGSRAMVRFDDTACWLTADRNGITLAINATPEPRTVPLDRPSGWRVALASPDGWRLDGPELRLPAWGVAVLERDRG
jgi:maltooligosyltrehalose trehalohydrolase